MAEAVFIYDGECPYCRSLSGALRRLDRTGRFKRLMFDSHLAQDLLQAQFPDGVGFAMYLIDQDHVAWGGTAAQRAVERLGWPRWAAQVIFWTYPTLMRLISTLSRRRRTICGPGCVVGNESGQVGLSSAASQALQAVLNKQQLA